MAKTKLNAGDFVRVVGERGISRIRAIIPAINGALLETELGGFRNWNLDELRLVKRREKENSRMTATSRARIKAAGIARERKTRPRGSISPDTTAKSIPAKTEQS